MKSDVYVLINRVLFSRSRFRICLDMEIPPQPSHQKKNMNYFVD